MDCKQLRDEASAGNFRLDLRHRGHIEGCELCRSWYRQERLRAALAREAIPEPDGGFTDRVLAAASSFASHEASPARRTWPAAAAAVMVVALAFLGWLAQPESTQDTAPEALAQARVVKLVIDAKEHRHQALLTIELTDGLQLEGFGDRRHIEWHTDLAKGRNLLTLPLRATSATSGDVYVALSYEGRTRTEMRVPVGA